MTAADTMLAGRATLRAMGDAALREATGELRAMLLCAGASLRGDNAGVEAARAMYRREKARRVESNPSFDGEQAAERERDFACPDCGDPACKAPCRPEAP